MTVCDIPKLVYHAFLYQRIFDLASIYLHFVLAALRFGLVLYILSAIYQLVRQQLTAEFTPIGGMHYAGSRVLHYQKQFFEIQANFAVSDTICKAEYD